MVTNSASDDDERLILSELIFRFNSQAQAGQINLSESPSQFLADAFGPISDDAVKQVAQTLRAFLALNDMRLKDAEAARRESKKARIANLDLASGVRKVGPGEFVWSRMDA